MAAVSVSWTACYGNPVAVRWACREAALKALQRNPNAVLKLLDDIIDSSPPNLARGDAQMYRNAINFLFILCLEITTPVFKVTALASDSLQEEGLDYSTAYKMIDGVPYTTLFWIL
ncbi:hypothetical protein GOODEAATRI_029057 [Goodea atripinnis]|uniref:Uncharacterized protein n=1 Tax=Goodea atripinnis TaxID=208336 RepID=A0ABV0P8Q6_9TELE